MTAESVAVYDKTYTKYPHVFRLVCPKGHQYLFQAESEDEMNDWIAKINYAATFKTIGLKIRNINVRSRRENRNPQNLLFNNKLGDHNSNEANGRANILRVCKKDLTNNFKLKYYINIISCFFIV